MENFEALPTTELLEMEKAISKILADRESERKIEILTNIKSAIAAWQAEFPNDTSIALTDSFDDCVLLLNDIDLKNFTSKIERV